MISLNNNKSSGNVQFSVNKLPEQKVEFRICLVSLFSFIGPKADDGGCFLDCDSAELYRINSKPKSIYIKQSRKYRKVCQ